MADDGTGLVIGLSVVGAMICCCWCVTGIASLLKSKASNFSTLPPDRVLAYTIDYV